MPPTQALSEATESNVAGNEVTPFVLRRVNELTAGGSLAANLALVKHNADVGAQIAVRLSERAGGRRAEREKKGRASGRLHERRASSRKEADMLDW